MTTISDTTRTRRKYGGGGVGGGGGESSTVQMHNGKSPVPLGTSSSRSSFSSDQQMDDNGKHPYGKSMVDSYPSSLMGSSGGSGWVRYVCSWLAAFFLVNGAIYFAFTPSHVRSIHRKVMEEQLAKFSESVLLQRTNLIKQIDAQSDILENQKKNLTLLEEALDVLKSGVGFVSRKHHEQEIDELRSDAESKKKEIDNLSNERAKLDVDVNNKMSSIESLKQEIEKSETELKKLRAVMDFMKVDHSRFCPECSFQMGNLKTTCASRMDFLMERYGNAKDVAMEAVMKWDPNCARKEAK